MNVKSKKDFFRSGPEIIEHDVAVYNNCTWETCSLCGLERKEKCERIKLILEKSSVVENT